MADPEEIGEMIIKRINQRKINPGGMATELTGAKGSGKTSLCLTFAELYIKKYPKELLFWREPLENPLQFIKCPKWEVFAEEGTELMFKDQNDGGRVMDIPFRTFEAPPVVSYDVEKMEKNKELFKEQQGLKRQQDDIFKKLCKMAKGARLSVVYFSKLQFWVDLLRYLRIVPKWQSVFIDEYEDLFPSYNTGELWKRIEWTKNNIKQIRKGLVNLFVNSQVRTDVDWRVRGKMDVWGYLFGSIVDLVSPVKKQAVANLKVGEGWLDYGRSLFGKINFPPYESREDQFWVAAMG